VQHEMAQEEKYALGEKGHSAEWARGDLTPGGRRNGAEEEQGSGGNLARGGAGGKETKGGDKWTHGVRPYREGGRVAWFELAAEKKRFRGGAKKCGFWRNDYSDRITAMLREELASECREHAEKEGKSLLRH